MLRNRYSICFILCAVLIVAPFAVNVIGLSEDLLTRIIIWGIFGIGLDLIFGYTGLLSFGQAAFYGTGGFVASYLITQTGVTFLPALLIGILATVFAGLLIGVLALRRTGIYFAMTTLAFGEMFYFLENSVFKAFTGGENGITGIDIPSINVFGVVIKLSSGMPMYTFCAVLFFIMFAIALWIIRSPFGDVLLAIKNNEARAAALGHRVKYYKLTVFIIASAYAGMAGVLLGVYQGYMPPEAFSLETSAQLVVQTVIGGAGTLIGPVIGAVVWLSFYDILQDIPVIGPSWRLGLGILFVVMVITFRHGLVGIVRAAARRRARRSKRPVHTGYEDIPALDADELNQRLMKTQPAAAANIWVLQCRGLTKNYGGICAVDDVELKVRRGDIHGIIGPNGAGKTTLFRMLSGEVMPSSGQVTFEDMDVTKLDVASICALGMSKSYQINHLFEDLTVAQNIAIGVHASLRGGYACDLFRSQDGHSGYSRQLRRLVKALGAMVGLEDYLSTQVSTLSYGEKRRLEICLAMSPGSHVLLLDEPLAGLSTEERREVVALLRTLKADRTIVIIEHDMDSLFSLADTISVIHQGRHIAQGAPAEIRVNPTVKHAYLGTEVLE